MIVVADAGPIIHLSLIGRIDLLPALYGRVLVPEPVYQEVVREGAALPGSAELDGADWAERVDPDPGSNLFEVLRAQLDPGETAAICLAVERGADLILSDDRPARLTAARLGIEVKGTLGILVEAKRRGELELIAPAIAALKREGTWLSDRLVERILAEAGEL
ncbi:MAG: DUF3368 domain-containing protein [Acidobacteriota bacterium]